MSLNASAHLTLDRVAMRYIVGIKNAEKRNYALDFASYLSAASRGEAREEPSEPTRDRLPAMASQAVRMRLRDIYEPRS